MNKNLYCIIFTSLSILLHSQYVLANNEPLDPYEEVTADRKGRQLCEALLYHNANIEASLSNANIIDINSWVEAFFNEPPSHQRMLYEHQWHNIREGSREWAALFFRAFASKANYQFITELFGIGPIHHANYFSLTTDYTLNLTSSEDFHKGVVYCATTNQVDDPELFAEGLKQLVLEADQNAGRMGVVTGVVIDLALLGTVVIKAVRTINTARRVFASTAFHQWLVQPRTITEIMKSPSRFFVRSIVASRWRIATATASAALAIVYDHYQIRKDHANYSQAQAQAQAQMTQTVLQNLATTDHDAQSAAQSEWFTRMRSYQQNIISKLDQTEALMPGSIERSYLETELSIHLDHYLKDYHLITTYLEDLRVRKFFLSTDTSDRNLEDQEYFLGEILEHLEVRKIKLEEELSDRLAERVESHEGYDRYQHLMVLLELMEMNRMRAEEEDYDREVYRQLVRENVRFRDIRLENLQNI